MNNELRIVTDLLSQPQIATEVFIEPEWFENKSLANVLSIIQQLKGTDYRVEDVYRELKAQFPFEAGTLDEWQVLARSSKNLGITEQMAQMVHRSYVDRELKRVSTVYAKTGAEKDAEHLQRLLEEKEQLKRVKQDGSLRNAYQEFLHRLDKEQPLLRTYDVLDKFLGGGLSGGQLVVIGARPAVGKTALGINMAMNILEKNKDARVDFFTLEMTEWQLMTRVIAKKARINSMLLRQPSKLVPTNREKAIQVFQETMKQDLHVFGAEYSLLNDIKQAIRKRAKEKPNQYVAFVDYAGLIRVTDGRKNERQTLNEVTRELKLLTNDLGIAIVLFSQLKRESESRIGENKKPTLADLKESGSLEQDANVVLLLSRNTEQKDIVDCQIAKNREGMIGCLPFKFIPQFMDFSPDY
ncbi:DnaB-like helicase C-terminal domain-containing protein [Enterococcus innesii]|uniref:DnaB-like helicase C-terminal domain-containing protein n=1 Tax=Enterococcus innesii TaxID=2839759 RepID=UPI0034A57D97